MNKESGVGFTFSKKQLNCKGIKLIMALLVLISFPITSANAATTSSASVNDVQQSKITGTVKSVTGEPLIGATVQIKGTTTGTVTDLNGNFSLNSANASVTLVVSYIGFEAIEVPASTSTPTEISLKELTTGLDEVVVIGYGVQKKKLVTGATVQVSGDDLQKQSTTSAMQALQGKTPGVQITSTSGQPGEGFKVSVRGLGTIGNSSPLYIVDGVATDNINYLNNSDIESIDVLKDAASAAIYGSRAANGVVLVTTKQGKAGKSQVTFDSYYGYQTVPKLIEMCNAAQYTELMKEQGSVVTDHPTGDTDWMSKMFTKNAVTQSYNLGLTGGNEDSKYSMSLAYTGQEGIVGGSDLSNYERYNGRFNSEHSLYKNILKVGQNLNYSYVDNKGIATGGVYGNSLRGAFNASPWLSMYDADGNYQDASSLKYISGQSNPYASMYYRNQTLKNNQKLLGNVYAELKPINNLTFRTSLGIDYNTNETRTFLPTFQLGMIDRNVNETKITQYMFKGITWLWENTANYSLDLNENKFVFMVGTSAQKYSSTDINGVNTNSAFYDLDHAYLSNATNKDGSKITLTGKPTDDKLQSYFGRVQYNYKETYMFNGTMRADGSSKFAKNHRWGYFPSVSAGWVLSNEEFMQSTESWLNFVKLRLSWGQNGNQNIDSYQYEAPIAFTKAVYEFGTSEGVSTNGSYPLRVANPNLKWETSEQTNIGLDARFLKNKLGFIVDVYKKATKDWLIIAPILSTAGADAPFINGGNVTNNGIELGINYNDKVGDFHYSASLNGAYNKNEVTKVPTSDGIIHGGTQTIYTLSPEIYRAETGHPIGYFWGWKTAGLFQTAAEVSAYKSTSGKIIQAAAKPGDVKYVDLNDDGVIDDKDKTEIGNPNPDITYGFNFSCDYKGFDFALQTSGVMGNQIVQSYRDPGNSYSNYTLETYNNRWSHGVGTLPRVTSGNTNWQFSDLYIHNGDYLRISNVTLGYNFSALAKKNFIQQCRVYFSVQNLYTFTKYNGMDPEVGYGADNGSTDKFSSGIDVGYYPHPRTYLVGVNLIF